MSSNQHRAGRVHNLSQHFDSLARTEDRDERSSLASTTTEESPSPEAPKTVFTGEHRVPLRERLRAMRQGVNERKLEAQRKSSRLSNAKGLSATALLPPAAGQQSPSPLDLNLSRACPSIPITTTTTPTPRTPKRSRPAPLPLDLDACPGAPVKSRKYLDLPVSMSGTDSDDLLFDRRAFDARSPLVSVSRSADEANERQRQRRRKSTAPGAPSPLRSSFNADEMAELAAQLDVMRAEIAAKEEEGGDQLTPEPFKGFERFAR